MLGGMPQFRPGKAHGAAETEQPRVNDSGAGFLQDFSAECLLPGFTAFGTASWPSPSHAITADQYNTIVGSYTESIRSVGNTIWSCIRREPGDQPVATVRANRELFAIARYNVSRHCHLSLSDSLSLKSSTVYRSRVCSLPSYKRIDHITISLEIACIRVRLGKNAVGTGLLGPMLFCRRDNVIDHVYYRVTYQIT